MTGPRGPRDGSPLELLRTVSYTPPMGGRPPQRLRAPGLALALLTVAASARGDGPPPVVVGPLSLSAEQLAERLGELSPLELRAHGAGAAGRLAYVQRVIVPELLFQAEAERQKLAEEPHVRARLRDASFQALVEQERAQLPPPTDAEIDAYYDAQRRDFERPERILLWRILVSSEAQARAVIEAARGAGGPERWRALAREQSLDTATKERGGDLGFVHPDGHTDVPELRVDPALFEAARGLEDGELVPEPIAEGNHFAVVWRRGSLQPVQIPKDRARPTIVRAIQEKKLGERIDGLVRELGAKYVTERRDELLEHVDVPPFPQSRAAAP